MDITITELITAFNEYNDSAQVWIANHNLVDLPEFQALHDKNIWGKSYHNDQVYYEQIADIKNKMFAVKSAALNLLTTKYNTISERENKGKTERFIENVDNNMRAADNLLEKAKRRLKFYETITYVVGNITYGSF